MRRAMGWTAILGVLHLACTETNPVPPLAEAGAAKDARVGDGATFDGSPPAGDALVPKADGLVCTPNTFLACKSSAQLVQCNAAGNGTITLSCSPYVCDPVAQRCTQCDPKSPPTCQGSELVFCTPEGLLVKTPCPSGCANGACTACTPQAFYLDGDHDGFGNPSAKVLTCLQPMGYVANNLDCDDLDAAAHPGQTAWFNVPTKGTQSYDYNCDKLEEKESPSTVNCVVVGMNCQGDGWVGSVPACGSMGSWAKCNKQGGQPPGCGMTTSNQNQSCR